MQASNAAARPDRKTIEKNRRIQMKDLYSKLISLLPSSNSKEGMAAPVTLPDRLEEVIRYIKGMQERVESMTKKKRRLMGLASHDVMPSCSGFRMLPKIEVEELSCGVKVMMVTSRSEHYQLMFWQAIRSLQIGGFEVAAASYAAAGDQAFHTIHSLPPESTQWAGGQSITAIEGAGDPLIIDDIDQRKRKSDITSTVVFQIIQSFFFS